MSTILKRTKKAFRGTKKTAAPESAEEAEDTGESKEADESAATPTPDNAPATEDADAGDVNDGSTDTDEKAAEAASEELGDEDETVAVSDKDGDEGEAASIEDETVVAASDEDDGETVAASDEDDGEGEAASVEDETVAVSDEDDDEEDFGFEDDDEAEQLAPGDRSRAARPVLIILALVALVLSGAVFYLLNQVNDARATTEAGDAAVSAARAHAQDVLSYDYRSLDANFQRGRAATTGGFRAQYQQTTSQLVRSQATKQKVVVQAAVMNAGLISAHGDNAVVLLFVDRVTSKAGQKKPTFNQDRVRMTMTKVDGKWLVSKLDAL